MKYKINLFSFWPTSKALSSSLLNKFQVIKITYFSAEDVARPKFTIAINPDNGLMV
jgi:hypothetical protein